MLMPHAGILWWQQVSTNVTRPQTRRHVTPTRLLEPGVLARMFDAREGCSRLPEGDSPGVGPLLRKVARLDARCQQQEGMINDLRAALALAGGYTLPPTPYSSPSIISNTSPLTLLLTILPSAELSGCELSSSRAQCAAQAVQLAAGQGSEAEGAPIATASSQRWEERLGWLRHRRECPTGPSPTLLLFIQYCGAE